MRTSFDFSPLFRSSIGFDRVFDLLENVARMPAGESWPPYDIVKTGENAYRISMAVAGFRPDEIGITQEPNLLIVRGTRSAGDGSSSGHYLHRGIAGRDFECRFELADHVEVRDARLDNGMLSIDLAQELPEEMKPRRIEIQSAGTALPKSGTRRIEGAKQAAA